MGGRRRAGGERIREGFWRRNKTILLVTVVAVLLILALMVLVLIEPSGRSDLPFQYQLF